MGSGFVYTTTRICLILEHGHAELTADIETGIAGHGGYSREGSHTQRVMFASLNGADVDRALEIAIGMLTTARALDLAPFRGTSPG